MAHSADFVRHQGKRFMAAPLAKHLAYLKREGVTRDGQDARMFDAASDAADAKAFAERWTAAIARWEQEGAPLRGVPRPSTTTLR